MKSNRGDKRTAAASVLNTPKSQVRRKKIVKRNHNYFDKTATEFPLWTIKKPDSNDVFKNQF